ADIYDEFVEKFTAAASSITPSDPSDPQTIIGPLSSQMAADNLQKQVDSAIAEGAMVVLGGSKVAEDSALFQPTILTVVTENMDVFHQELFGPVAMIFKVSSEEEAVNLAND